MPHPVPAPPPAPVNYDAIQTQINANRDRSNTAPDYIVVPDEPGPIKKSQTDDTLWFRRINIFMACLFFYWLGHLAGEGRPLIYIGPVDAPQFQRAFIAIGLRN